MKIKLSFAGLILSAFVVFSCALNSNMKQTDYGTVAEGKYSNPFFGFEMNLPSDWSVQSREQTMKIREAGLNKLAGSNEELKEAFAQGKDWAVNLLSVFKYPLGTPVPYNPSLIISANNVEYVPGIETPEDYFDSARKLMLKTEVAFKHIDTAYQKVKLGGQEFYTMNVAFLMQGITVNQTYYCTFLRKHSLNIILSHNTSSQMEELDVILNSLQFTPKN